MKDAREYQIIPTGRGTITEPNPMIGQTVRFDSGDKYRVTETGSVVRHKPKVWRGKSGRRAYLKHLRAVREAANA